MSKGALFGKRKNRRPLWGREKRNWNHMKIAGRNQSKRKVDLVETDRGKAFRRHKEERITRKTREQDQEKGATRRPRMAPDERKNARRAASGMKRHKRGKKGKNSAKGKGREDSKEWWIPSQRDRRPRSLTQERRKQWKKKKTIIKKNAGYTVKGHRK